MNENLTMGAAPSMTYDPWKPTGLGGTFSSTSGSAGPGLGLGIFSGLEESIRRRSSWNDRFEHWEKAESTSETQRIERARDMVQAALSVNERLKAQSASLAQQGSFTNRTNTRGESDIDLRVQHPDIYVEFGPGVDRQAAWAGGGYYATGRNFSVIAATMRSEIVGALRTKFGHASVDDSGKKAIRVRGLEGSRSEVDVVPCFTLHRISAGTLLTGSSTRIGVAILGSDGKWTFNYPDHHIANGRAKRKRTALRFKRVVRTIKLLQTDMIERGVLSRRIPSFLIECLVYIVEDVHFLVETDDRYIRIKRVLTRVAQLLNSGLFTWTLTEINGIKPLFGDGQAWTLGQAQDFVSRALTHLGDA